MLVLQRKPKESVVIGPGVITTPITVTVVEVRTGDRVRLGIDAERSIPVNRAEKQPQPRLGSDELEALAGVM